MPVGLAGLATCWREQKTQMPTPQEIELRAQLARRDERILELEKLQQLAIANKRIQELEKQRDQLLDVIERAVRRLEIARANGESVMLDWVADAKAVIAIVKGGA